MRVLFKTVHGSHLYGLASESSDLDLYTVVADNPTVRSHYCRQTIVDGVDSTVIDLSTWLEQVAEGVPQACEAMFSRKAEIDTFPEMRAALILTSQAWERYLRTIKAFAFEERGGPEYAFKRRRHALRLALNLAEMQWTGQFNPTIHPRDVERINRWADNSSETVYHAALSLARF